MRKRKAMLAMLLSAAITAGTISLAFAGELTDGSFSSYEENEDVLTQGEESIPEENTAEAPEEETDILPEAGTEVSMDVLDDGTEDLAEEIPEAEDSDKEEDADTGADNSYYDEVAPEKDENGNIIGVSIKKYKEDTIITTLYWNAEDGTWSYVEEETKKPLPYTGIWELLGTGRWNIQFAEDTSEATKAQGGYVINHNYGRWEYYLTEKDVKTEAPKLDFYNKDLPDNFYIGAEADEEDKEAFAGLYQANEEELYYLEKDSSLVKNDTRIVENIKYYFNESGICCKKEEIKEEAGWIQTENGDFYWRQEDGTILREGGWHELDGKMYFLNYGSGRRRTGWISWNKRKFYIAPDTVEVQTGMQQVDGKWYYFDPVSKPAGRMVVGWKTLEDGKYYFDQNGVRKKGWLTVGEKKYYFEQSGVMKKGWRSISGNKYYFDQKNGYMRKGWVTIGSDKYYMNKDGSLHTGWRSLSGKKYYFAPKTGKMKKGWLTLNNKKYYFEKDGHQTFGWRSIGGKVYYFMPLPNSGYMQTGWLTIGENKYYMDLDGSRCTGLKKITGKNYYFAADGKMLKNKRAYFINGKRYNISENGVVMEMSKAEHLAAATLDEIGWDLYSAFKWSSSAIDYYRHDFVVPDGYDNPSDYYAEYGFTTGRGNCYIMAGTFYHMARLLGYEVHQVNGSVPLAAGGMGPHSWVEIVVNGSTYVCDPDFTYDSGRNGYMIYYKQPGTWMYMNYHRIN